MDIEFQVIIAGPNEDRWHYTGKNRDEALRFYTAHKDPRRAAKLYIRLGKDIKVFDKEQIIPILKGA